mgnify:CR=1 FL=1
MTEYLYLEGKSGISGDMTVAALLDLGASAEKLKTALNSLPAGEFDWAVERKSSYGVSGLDFDVRLTRAEHRHDHDHEHNHDHPHEHRHLADVFRIIDHANVTDAARGLAKKIFQIVAEAKAHGCAVEEVHFHEVGAVDSIVDIVAAAVLIDDLGVKNVIVDGLNEGRGFVTCQHGVLPVPVPAVLNIAETHGVALRPTDVDGEMVTPTGIAIAAAIRTADRLPASFKIKKSGVGLGKRDFHRANFLRAMLIDDETDADQMYVIETNIDDSTAEELGLAMEKLFAAGAADVHFEPCFMKKNRPAYMLRVVAAAKRLPVMEDIIFRNTSTIGLRKYAVERRCMDREIVRVALPCGEIEVKKCTLGDIARYNPEYESVKRAAESSGLPFREIFDAARRAAKESDNA